MPDRLEKLQAALGGQYAVQRQAGEGGVSPASFPTVPIRLGSAARPSSA